MPQLTQKLLHFAQNIVDAPSMKMSLFQFSKSTVICQVDWQCRKYMHEEGEYFSAYTNI